jgi:nucleoside-diphosphate-sugar epimerase
MTLCITGAAGFIGSHLCELALSMGLRVIGIDCFLEDSYSGEIKRENISKFRENSLFDFYELDMSASTFPEVLENCDQVVHLAAMPGLMKSWEDPSLYVKHNIQATVNLIESLKLSQLQSFILGSTSSVYGLHATGQSDSTLAPISPYGATKLSAELIAQSYMRSSGLPLQILRFFSVYGPRQRPDMAYDIFIRKILRSESFAVFGDGEQTRSNTYVTDICNAIFQSLRLGATGSIMNISGVERVSINQAIRTIEDFLNIKSKIEYQNTRPGDQRETHGVSLEAWKTIDYFPKVIFKDGIENQIRAILDER